jgi:predicted RNA methylase
VRRRFVFATLVSVLCLEACAHQPEVQKDARPAAAPEQAPARPLAIPTEADVKSWSHAVLDAFDRGEIAPLEVALSNQFVQFEDGRRTSREELLAQVRGRKPDDSHIGNRAWETEQVITGPQGAVFIGKAIEHSAGNEVHGGDEFQGFYKLVWVPAGDRYQLIFWAWQLGGRAGVRAFWDERYRHATGFNKEPNQLLVDVTAKIDASSGELTALDLAMGQGRNALYLASQGWRVTGVDFSPEATRQAAEQAEAQELELEIIQEDIDKLDFGVAKYDLVTMLYATDNVDWIERSKKALKRGGLFVYEFFQGDANDKGLDSTRLATMFKDGFEIVRNDVVRGTPDWARNEATLLRFVAKKR